MKKPNMPKRLWFCPGSIAGADWPVSPYSYRRADMECPDRRRGRLPGEAFCSRCPGPTKYERVDT